jgi:hypothetical protein
MDVVGLAYPGCFFPGFYSKLDWKDAFFSVPLYIYPPFRRFFWGRAQGAGVGDVVAGGDIPSDDALTDPKRHIKHFLAWLGHWVGFDHMGGT